MPQSDTATLVVPGLVEVADDVRPEFEKHVLQYATDLLADASRREVGDRHKTTAITPQYRSLHFLRAAEALKEKPTTRRSKAWIAVYVGQAFSVGAATLGALWQAPDNQWDNLCIAGVILGVVTFIALGSMEAKK